MRALWSGVIQFGLIVLPVKLFSATDEQQVRLREIHAADNGRVQHRRFCEAEDREIRECGGGPLPVWMAPQALFCGGDGRDRPGASGISGGGRSRRRSRCSRERARPWQARLVGPSPVGEGGSLGR